LTNNLKRVLWGGKTRIPPAPSSPVVLEFSAELSNQTSEGQGGEEFVQTARLTGIIKDGKKNLQTQRATNQHDSEGPQNEARKHFNRRPS